MSGSNVELRFFPTVSKPSVHGHCACFHYSATVKTAGATRSTGEIRTVHFLLGTIR